MKLRDVLCQPDYGGDLYPYGFVVCEDPKCVEGGENYENGNETGRSVQATTDLVEKTVRPFYSTKTVVGLIYPKYEDP